MNSLLVTFGPARLCVFALISAALLQSAFSQASLIEDAKLERGELEEKVVRGGAEERESREARRDREMNSMDSEGEPLMSAQELKGRAAAMRAQIAKAKDEKERRLLLKEEAKHLVFSELQSKKADSLVERRLKAYLSDEGNPEIDRYKVSSLWKEAKFRRMEHGDRDSVLRARELVAEELISEFPLHRGGYGYMLSIAKSQGGEAGRRMANRLSSAEVPEQIRKQAGVLLEQLDLVGTKLEVEGLDLDSYRGKPLVIYSWDGRRRPPQVIRDHPSVTNLVGFIGICLSPEPEIAAEKYLEWELPGEQICDGESLWGGMARALKMTTQSTIYFLNENGIVLDVEGQNGFGPKFSEILKAEMNKGKGGQL